MRVDIGSLGHLVVPLNDFAKGPDVEHKADCLETFGFGLRDSFVNEA